MTISFKKKIPISAAMLVALAVSFPAFGVGETKEALPSITTVPSSPVIEQEAKKGNDSITLLEGNVTITNSPQLITLSLRESDVRQVLRMLADKAGLNIILHESVKGEVTLDLVNVSLNKSFEYVMVISDLSYWIDGDTLIVAAKDSSKDLGFSQQQIKTFDVKYENAGKIAAFLNKNIFTLKTPGLSAEEVAITNPSKNQVIIIGTEKDFKIAEKIIEQFDKRQNAQTFNVNHTAPGKMAGLVCKQVFGTEEIKDESADPDGKGGAKLACGSKDIQDSEVDGTFSSFKGNGFSVIYYPDLSKISVTGATDKQLELIAEVIKEQDIKLPQAILEMSIIQLSEQGSKELSSTWAIYAGGLAFDGGYSAMTSEEGQWGGSSGSFGSMAEQTVTLEDGTSVGVIVPGGNIFGSSNNPYINAITNALGIKPSGYETYYLGKPNYGNSVAHHLKMLISQSKGRVLANPKVVVKNNVESSINITEDYVKSIKAQVGNTGTLTPIVTTDYQIGQYGIKITVKPTITPDGYVYLDMKPSYSVPAGKVSANGGSITLTSQRDLDIKRVRLRDGETFIVGGLIQETESKESRKIPILGDLPIIGFAFRASTNTRIKNELVILVTPKIVNDDMPQRNM